MNKRAAFGRAFQDLGVLPRAWANAAIETREKDGQYTHATGISSGLDIAAKQLQVALDAMAEAAPKCPHGKSVLETCIGWGC